MCGWEPEVSLGLSLNLISIACLSSSATSSTSLQYLSKISINFTFHPLDDTQGDKKHWNFSFSGFHLEVTNCFYFLDSHFMHTFCQFVSQAYALYSDLSYFNSITSKYHYSQLITLICSIRLPISINQIFILVSFQPSERNTILLKRYSNT